LATTGVNRDTLYVVGWLNLSKGSLVLHVPDILAERVGPRPGAGVRRKRRRPPDR
jgi:hypothetical protein